MTPKTTPKRTLKSTSSRIDLSTVPDAPGIYKMLSSDGTVLYVGKAKSLTKRVRSYFSKDHRQDSLKTAVLVRQIVSVETIVTHNEAEAFILENQLIKHFQPKYNILLKDDKSYPYIKITIDEPFPRVIVTRRKHKDGARYFGPFTSLGSSRAMIRFLYDLFPIRDCRQDIDLENLQPKCLNLDLGKCIGPCVIKSCKADYDALISELISFLSGNYHAILASFKSEMAQHSKDLAFEKAAMVRDKIEKVLALCETQQVDSGSEDNFHILSCATNSDYYYFLVQDVIGGKLLYQDGRYVAAEEVSSLSDFLAQSVISYYDSRETMPKRIIADSRFRDALSHVSVPAVFPQKGKKKLLLETAEKNARFSLVKLSKQKFDKRGDDADGMSNLKLHLGLPKLPKLIFGFDVSHYYGNDIVGSCVVFQNGKPATSLYRHFIVRSVQDGISNDFQSMFELVQRRISRVVAEKQPYPDLILVDGGAQQLRFCRDALGALSKEIPSIGIAKRFEEIYISPTHKPIRLPRRDSGLQLLQRVRDESHRFALSFQRKRRNKSFSESILNDIPGLGKARISALYKAFKSIDGIRNASVSELARIAGIGPKIAEEICVILSSNG